MLPFETGAWKQLWAALALFAEVRCHTKTAQSLAQDLAIPGFRDLGSRNVVEGGGRIVDR
jgi:hypothetical protein